MVDVVPYKDKELCIVDQTLMTLAKDEGRTRLNFIFNSDFPRIPPMGLCYVECERISVVPYDDVIKACKMFQVEDSVIKKLGENDVKKGDLFKFEFEIKIDPLLLGFKVCYKGQTYKTKWSHWFASKITKDVRLVINAPKDSFCLYDMTNFNDYVFFGPSRAMAKRRTMFCTICLDPSCQFLAYKCGHMVCVECHEENTRIRKLCSECQQRIGDPISIRLWEDICPIDACDHAGTLRCLIPCGCAFFHKKPVEQLIGKPCPFKKCAVPVEEVIQIFYHDD